MRPCCRRNAGKKVVFVWLYPDFTAAAAAYATFSQDYHHTAERREYELEHQVRTSSYITGLCFYKLYSSTKYSRGGYSSTSPWLRWHLYCYPLAAGILRGKGFLAIWDQKAGIGAPFIGTLPSTYSPVEPAGFW